ncbi:hypothetical protein DENSPDRAFT_892183 [Dentipellis sp. KUC8613]|nr:hypothetical protein DENSPDRAFT_892183 [Dentipellis sp. KUC8613]
MQSLFQLSNRSFGLVATLSVALFRFAIVVFAAPAAGYPMPKAEMAPYNPRSVTEPTVRDAGDYNVAAVRDSLIDEFSFNLDPYERRYLPTRSKKRNKRLVLKIIEDNTKRMYTYTRLKNFFLLYGGRVKG